MSRVLAIVPAYNEEKRIKDVVLSLMNTDSVDTVLVVDDASQDNTAFYARKAGAVVIVHIENLGQGAALETGHEYARRNDYDLVVHFDGDGQFDTQDIAPAIETLEDHRADLLCGSRFLLAKQTASLPLFKRKVILPLARVLIDRLFFSIRLTDSHNGFRVLTKHALYNISITQNRMAHATQIPAQATKRKLKIVEFPVTVTYHEFGQGVGGGFRIIKELFMGIFH